MKALLTTIALVIGCFSLSGCPSGGSSGANPKSGGSTTEQRKPLAPFTAEEITLISSLDGHSANELAKVIFKIASSRSVDGIACDVKKLAQLADEKFELECIEKCSVKQK